MPFTTRASRWRWPLVLTLTLGAAVLAACGDDDNDGGGGGGGRGKDLTLIAGVKGDEFYITMNCGAQAEAKKLGVSLNFQGPTSSRQTCRRRSSTRLRPRSPTPS